jgi:hypothetical protein
MVKHIRAVPSPFHDFRMYPLLSLLCSAYRIVVFQIYPYLNDVRLYRITLKHVSPSSYDGLLLQVTIA